MPPENSPALTKTRKFEKQGSLELSERAYNDAKKAAEAQFEYGKYMSSNNPCIIAVIHGNGVTDKLTL